MKFSNIIFVSDSIIINEKLYMIGSDRKMEIFSASTKLMIVYIASQRNIERPQERPNQSTTCIKFLSFWGLKVDNFCYELKIGIVLATVIVNGKQLPNLKEDGKNMEFNISRSRIIKNFHVSCIT